MVNHLADRVAVLYLGRLVEVAPREELFATPSHPYTTALLEAVPRIGRRRRRAVAIKGEMPSPLDPPPGCVFHHALPEGAGHLPQSRRRGWNPRPGGPRSLPPATSRHGEP